MTAEQRKLLQVNLVVALIRSNQHEQATKEAAKISKDHHAFSGIKAFFLIKDKKYDEALQSIKAKKEDSYSVFLRAQIYLAKKEPKQAFETLLANLSDELLNHDGYINFLLRQSSHHKVDISGLISKLLSTKNPQQNKDLLITLSEFAPIPAKSLEILRGLYAVHGSTDS